MDEISKEFEQLINMFAHPGWKVYVKSVEELERALTENAVDGADTNDKWQYCRGQTHQLRATLGYENFIRSAQKQHEEDLKEKARADVI